jgi:predicted nucleic acid-binding protein
MKEADKGIQIFNTIPIRYIETDFSKILYLSKENNMYAYDAYFLDCAIRHKAPLLTLDKKLRIIAENLNIETLEV